jgi:hypothetical protein
MRGPTDSCPSLDRLPEHERHLLAAFEESSLPPDEFTHARHLHLAWLHLRLHGFPGGAVRFVNTLKRYVARAGAPAKYHETITWAYIVLLNEELVLRAKSDETFAELVARRPELLSHRGGALSRYYTPEQLGSADARRAFLLPAGTNGQPPAPGGV